MKPKHVKNTGTNGQEGANWKFTRGAKRANCQGGQTGQISRGGGAKGAKNCTGGTLPLWPLTMIFLNV